MTLARAVGCLAWLMFAVGLALAVLTALKPKPEGVNPPKMPALAMEFVKTDEDLRGVIGPPGDARWAAVRDDLKKGLAFDYGFIVLYWLLYLGIAAVLARTGAPSAYALAAAAALCATAAAACDVFENLHMARVIDEMRMASDVATPGFLKWLFIFVTLALLSRTFLGRGGAASLAGAACLLIAFVGFAGLLLIKLGVRQLWPVALAFLLMLFVLLPLVAYSLTFRAEEFARAAAPS